MNFLKTDVAVACMQIKSSYMLQLFSNVTLRYIKGKLRAIKIGLPCITGGSIGYCERLRGKLKVKN